MLFGNDTRNATIAGVPMINADVMRLTQNGRILPYIADTVFCNFGKNYFTSFAEYWMDKDYKPDTEIYHVEESLQLNTIRLTNSSTLNAVGPGQSLTVTYGSNPVDGYAQVQAGFFVAVPPSGKLAKIISVNVNNKTFVIEPLDASYRMSIPANSDLLIAPAAVVAACSCDTLPGSTRKPGVLYKSNMTIIQKSLKICGEDLAKWTQERMLFEMKDPLDPCKTITVWWHGDLNQLWWDFTQAKQLFVLLGEEISNTSNNFTGLKMTTGVLPTLRSSATQLPVAAATGTDYDYWYDFTMKIKTTRNYCTMYGAWQGAIHRAQTDKAFEGKVSKQETEASWNFLNNDKQKGIRFGFDAAKINGIELYFHDEESFNDPGFLGAAGFNGPSTTILIPLCKVQCGQRGLSTPIVLNYLAGNGINRELIENDYGVLKPGSNQSNCDWHQWDLKSQFGVDFYCPKLFGFTESI